MEVKEGYKQTDVGIVPDDWDVTTVGKVADTSSGTTPSRSMEERYYHNGTIAWVKTLDLNNSEIYSTDENVTQLAINETSLKIYPIGTVLVAMYGGFNQIGRTGLLCNPATINQALTAIRPNAKILSSQYLLRVLNFRVEYWKSVASSSRKDPNITGKDVRDFPLALPKIEEQDAIAEALSDADALIEALEQLLAKKRQVKQGAMQELLCPKENWVEKKLGNTAVLKARIGWQGLTTKEYLDTGEYFLITGTEFKNGYIDWNDCHFVNASRYKQDKNIQVKEHDVLVTKDGTIGKVALITDLPKPATLNSGVFVIRPIEDAFHPEFFYYLLCSSVFTEFLNQLSAGSTINHLYQKDFVNFVYKTPPTLEEQTAIAEILNDMDAEIGALEAKLAKARQVKQGMMQELLTGKTRLVNRK